MRRPLFDDRQQAGRRLARRLMRFKEHRPVVLALPRGGVPVGFEVAQALAAPLDVLLVRKIGCPFHQELAVGAVVDGERPEVVVNQDVARAYGITEEYIREDAASQLKEIARRHLVYRSGQKPAEVQGRTAIVVDDGIATGASIRAALRAVRRWQPQHTVLAVPVAPADTLEDLQGEADEFVCLETPADFHAVGLYYADFRQLRDEDVIEVLAAARKNAQG